MQTRNVFLAAAAAATLLSGCGESRAALPVGAPFAGTWLQVAGAASGSSPDHTDSLGFVSFGSDRVTASMMGGERGVYVITENISDPALRTGRLRLDDGSELFLCAGQGFVDLPLEDGRLLAPTAWLDLRWIRSDRRESTFRLWSSDALAAAELAKRAPARHAVPDSRTAVATPVPTPADRAVRPADPRDRQLTESAGAKGDRHVIQAAQELVAARAAGADERSLSDLFARWSLTNRGDLLALLDAARDGQSDALVRADHLREGLLRFDQAFGEWLPTQP